MLQVSSSRVRIMDRRQDGVQPQSPQTGRLIHVRVAIRRDYACFRAVSAASIAAPSRMSCSDTSISVSPKSRIASTRMIPPATIVGARSGCRPRTSAALRPAARRGPRGSARSAQVTADGRRRARGRRARGQVDRREGRRGAGHRDARLLRCARNWSRDRRRKTLATAARHASSSGFEGGSVCRKRSVWRSEPSYVETKNSTWAAAPRRSPCCRRRCRAPSACAIGACGPRLRP